MFWRLAHRLLMTRSMSQDLPARVLSLMISVLLVLRHLKSDSILAIQPQAEMVKLVMTMRQTGCDLLLVEVNNIELIRSACSLGYDGAGGTRMTLNATGLGVGGSPGAVAGVYANDTVWMSTSRCGLRQFTNGLRVTLLLSGNSALPRSILPNVSDFTPKRSTALTIRCCNDSGLSLSVEHAPQAVDARWSNGTSSDRSLRFRCSVAESRNSPPASKPSKLSNL
jgi:hypothetical protein